MRASFALTSAFAAAMSNTAFNGNMGVASAQRRFDAGPNIVRMRSCDEFPGRELDVTGTVTFLGEINCREPTIMHVNKELMLRSHAVIETRNVHFVVHEGATLLFHAPAMTIARDEASTVPLFDVSGVLMFKAARSIPGLMEGSLVDEGDIVRIKEGGSVKTAQHEIRYSADSVTVSKTVKPGQEQGDPDRQAVELRPALKRAQAAYHAKLKAAPDDITSSSSSSIPPVSASSSASSTSSHEHGGNDGEIDAFLSTNDSDTPDGLEARHSAPYGHAPTDAATKSAEDDGVRHATSRTDHNDITDRSSGGTSPIASTNPTPASTSSPISGPSPTVDSGTRKNPDSPTSTPSRSPSSTPTPYSGSPGIPNGDSPRPSHSQGHRDGHSQNQSPTPTPTPTPTPGSPDSPQWESNDDQSGARSDSRQGSGPKLALRVGEVLNQPALSLSGKSMLWPGADGSIMFRKEMDAAINVSEGSSQTVSTVMVAPDAGLLKRVLLARMALWEEKRKGDVPESEKGTWVAWGWLPWRRQHLKDIDRARGRLGQLEMTLDDRGGLDVSMDGLKVASRSGSNKREWVNRFPWRRRKNKDYELYVTEEGFEVKLGERRIWGITANRKG